MKRLAALLMSVLLAGCAAAPMTQVRGDPPAQSEVIPAMEPLPAAPVEMEETIRYEVETVVYGDTRQTEQGEHLVTYVFNTPRLSAYRADGTPISGEDGFPSAEAKKAGTDAERHALAVTQAFNEKFEEWTTFEGLDALVADAAGDLALCQADGREWHGGYYLKLECAIYRTDHLISVFGAYYSYTGGAHPNIWQLGWNFDLREGLFFGPELIADGTELQEAVTAEILRQAHLPLEDGTVPAEWYWEDYEAIAANWSSYSVTFDERGMTVIFSPYEIAAYSFGPQEFLLSYDFLAPYLSAHGRELLGLEAAE